MEYINFKKFAFFLRGIDIRLGFPAVPVERRAIGTYSFFKTILYNIMDSRRPICYCVIFTVEVDIIIYVQQYYLRTTRVMTRAKKQKRNIFHYDDDGVDNVDIHS